MDVITHRQKKCKLDSAWVGPYLVVSLAGWAVGIQLQPDSPVILVHCQDVKKIPCPSGLVSWIDANRPMGLPKPLVLCASTMGHSTQRSLSIAVVPPEEGTLLSGCALVESARLLLGSLSYHPEGSVMDVSSDTPGTVVIFLPQEVLLVDATISLHPFFMHRLDVGPIRLTTIVHAFNYRVAVLRDGVKSAARVGRSRRAAERILEDVDIPWGHQVAVMFQIVCALALEVPSVLQDIESLHGVSPNVSLSCEPWGHTDHTGRDCTCLSADSTGTYVHDLSLATKEVSPMEEMEDLSAAPGGDGVRMSLLPGAGTGRPGSVPFVSHRPGTYGRLFLLAVYVRWKTGLLVVSDWLRPVTRGWGQAWGGGGGGVADGGGGGGWQAGGPTSHRALCG